MMVQSSSGSRHATSTFVWGGCCVTGVLNWTNDGPNSGMRKQEKTIDSCRLFLTSCNQLLPNKIKNGIISHSVESPLEIDGFVFIIHVSVFLET